MRVPSFVDFDKLQTICSLSAGKFIVCDFPQKEQGTFLLFFGQF